MRANLSIYGLYNYDNTIFDNLEVPQEIEKDLVVENILLECAELECIYPNPDLMKMAIGVWSRKELPVWSRMSKAMSLEYNPIENYDRKEHIEETETRDLKTKNTETRDLTNKTTYSGNDTFDTSVSAYDSSNLTPRDKQVTNFNSSDTTDDDGTVTDEFSDTGTVKHVHDNNTHGNIGVTTSQQMLESELKVSKNNITDYIIISFKNRFCLLVY